MERVCVCTPAAPGSVDSVCVVDDVPDVFCNPSQPISRSDEVPTLYDTLLPSSVLLLGERRAARLKGYLSQDPT